MTKIKQHIKKILLSKTQLNYLSELAYIVLSDQYTDLGCVRPSMSQMCPELTKFLPTWFDVQGQLAGKSIHTFRTLFQPINRVEKVAIVSRQSSFSTTKNILTIYKTPMVDNSARQKRDLRLTSAQPETETQATYTFIQKI